jgi:hypothetical protein
MNRPHRIVRNLRALVLAPKHVLVANLHSQIYMCSVITMNEMSHASAIRPAWADEYPEFYKHQSSGLGELLRVDEFNVPYWSGYPTHVWIRASHPIIQCERRVLHDQSEMNALDKLLQKYDEINAREQEQCALESEKLFLLKQPRPFEIKFYEEAKSIFMSATVN